MSRNQQVNFITLRQVGPRKWKLLPPGILKNAIDYLNALLPELKKWEETGDTAHYCRIVVKKLNVFTKRNRSWLSEIVVNRDKSIYDLSPFDEKRQLSLACDFIYLHKMFFGSRGFRSFYFSRRGPWEKISLSERKKLNEFVNDKRPIVAAIHRAFSKLNRVNSHSHNEERSETREGNATRRLASRHRLTVSQVEYVRCHPASNAAAFLALSRPPVTSILNGCDIPPTLANFLKVIRPH